MITNSFNYWMILSSLQTQYHKCSFVHHTIDPVPPPQGFFKEELEFLIANVRVGRSTKHLEGNQKCTVGLHGLHQVNCVCLKHSPMSQW